MENTSKETKPIPRRDRAYYRRRQQNRIYSAIASFFAEEAAAGRITKKKLADLIEKNPAQITRWLSEPSNFEIDTFSDILLAMGAEMDHRVVRFRERAKPNYVHPLIARLTKTEAVVQPEQNYKPEPRAQSNTRIVQLELAP
ncbi:MAG: hypothetical protein GEU95_17685 [Rhizobiales bacterium]|nr:hypothetical protein [Hyphomicrobiales bacterium]